MNRVLYSLCIIASVLSSPIHSTQNANEFIGNMKYKLSQMEVPDEATKSFKSIGSYVVPVYESQLPLQYLENEDRYVKTSKVNSDGTIEHLFEFFPEKDAELLKQQLEKIKTNQVFRFKYVQAFKELPSGKKIPYYKESGLILDSPDLSVSHPSKEETEFLFWELDKAPNPDLLFDYMKLSKEAALQVLTSGNPKFYKYIPDVIKKAIGIESELIQAVFTYPKLVHLDPSATLYVPKDYIFQVSHFSDILENIFFKKGVKEALRPASALGDFPKAAWSIVFDTFLHSKKDVLLASLLNNEGILKLMSTVETRELQNNIMKFKGKVSDKLILSMAGDEIFPQLEWSSLIIKLIQQHHTVTPMIIKNNRIVKTLGQDAIHEIVKALLSNPFQSQELISAFATQSIHHRISDSEWNSMFVSSIKENDYDSAIELVKSNHIVSILSESSFEEIVKLLETNTKNSDKMLEFLNLPPVSYHISNSHIESIFISHVKQRNAGIVSKMLDNGHFMKRISVEKLNELMYLMSNTPFEGTRVTTSLLNSIAKKQITGDRWGQLLIALIEKGHDLSASLILNDSVVMSSIPSGAMKTVIDRISLQPFRGSSLSESFGSGPIASHVSRSQWTNILKSFIKKLDYKAVSNILENESILDAIPEKERIAMFKHMLKTGSFPEHMSDKALSILKSTLASSMTKSMKEGPEGYNSRARYRTVQQVLPNGSTIDFLEMIQDSDSNEDSVLIKYKKLPGKNNILTYTPQRIVPNKNRKNPLTKNAVKNSVNTHPLPKGVHHKPSILAKVHI